MSPRIPRRPHVPQPQPDLRGGGGGNSALVLAILAVVALLCLTACGGGSCDEAPRCDDTKSNQPVDCQARPELCK